MLDIEMIPKLLIKMVAFLEPLVPKELLENYRFILKMDPIDQKCAIQRELKPYEFDLDGLVEKIFKDHNIHIESQKKEDITKFKRYLEALCECA